MRLFLYLFALLALTSCSKGPKRVDSPSRTDTLGVGWKKILLPTNDDVGDIFFVNNTTGFAVAGKSVFRTTDGGESWQKVYQSENVLANLAMGTSNNVLITLYYKNRVLSTRDGGISFDSTAFAGDPVIVDAFFVSPTVAYVVGQKTWKTTNAGLTWTSISAFDPNNAISYKSLYFLNDQTGWVTGGGFFRTTDGGATWATQSFPGASNDTYGNIYFANINTGYVTDPIAIYKTSNGGTSYSKVFQTYNGGYHDVHFVSAQTGYVTDEQYILKTSDGGQTWTKDVVLKTDRLIELHFTDAFHGWASGSTGLILKYQQ